MRTIAFVRVLVHSHWLSLCNSGWQECWRSGPCVHVWAIGAPSPWTLVLHRPSFKGVPHRGQPYTGVPGSVAEIGEETSMPHPPWKWIY